MLANIPRPVKFDVRRPDMRPMLFTGTGIVAFIPPSTPLILSYTLCETRCHNSVEIPRT